MSALDTVTGSFVIGDTQTTDLPVYVPWESDFVGTSAQPEVQAVPRSEPGISVSGILDAVSSTAKSALNIWGTVQNINTSAATQRAEQEINRAKLDLVKTQTLGAIDVAKVRTGTEGTIAKIQAQTAVAREEQVLSAAKGGTFATAVQSPNLWMIGGVLLSLYLATRKTGAK